MRQPTVLVNRAPVLTLWASVVAERLGYEEGAALSLARAVAGLNAQSKGRRLGIYKPAEPAEILPKRKIPREEQVWLELLGRTVPAKRTAKGIRALDKDRTVEPESVRRYSSRSSGLRSGKSAGPWKPWPGRSLPKSWRPKRSPFMNVSGPPFPPEFKAGEPKGSCAWN